GQVVTVTIDGNTYTATVTGNAWTFNIPVADIANFEATEEVVATVSDLAGNPATPATRNITVDTTAPTVTINAIAVDDIINAVEAGSPVAVSGTTTGVEDGQVVTVTIDGNTYTATVTGNAWTFNIPVADIANFEATEEVVATVSDLAGNPATPATRNITVDTVAPAVNELDITDNTDTGADDLITSNGNPVLTFTGEPGLTITLTGPDGALAPSAAYTVAETPSANGSTYTVILLDAIPNGEPDPFGDFANGVATNNPDNTGDGTYTIVATDAAGNSVEVDEFVIDTTPPNIAITAITNDSGTPGDFITNDQTLIYSGTTDANATVTVTLTDSSNNPVFTATTTADANGNWSLDRTANETLAGGTYTLTASTTDLAGNTTTDTQAIRIETNAPGIAIASISTDSGIPGDFVTNDQTLVIAGTWTNLDTNTLAVTFNGTTYTFGENPQLTVSGNNWTLDLSGITTPPGDYVITAVTTDLANNTSQATQNVTIDTTAPNASITLTSNITADDVINAVEAGQLIPITGTVGGNVRAGDIVTLAIGGQTFTGAVANGGTFSIDVPGSALVADPDRTIQASVTTTDLAGNSTTATDTESYTVDTTVPGAPIVTITEDVNNDGLISVGELSGLVDVSIAIPGGVVAGDILTISDGTTPQTIVLTAAQINAGVVTTQVAVPNPGTTLTVTAFVTDIAGNQGTSGRDSAVLDTTAPGAPTVTITEDTNNDGFISAGELNGLVDVSIALPTGLVAGDTLTISDGTTPQTIVLTTAQITAGVVTTQVAVPNPGTTLTVTAFVTDIAGNQGPSGRDSAVLDTTAPEAPVVTIAEDANNDGLISAGELNGLVDVLIALPTGLVAGDTLTISDGTTPQTIVLTAAQINAGVVTTQVAVPAEGATLTVSAFITDNTGNQGPDGSDSAVLNTTAPNAGPLDITDATDTGADDLLSSNGNPELTFTGEPGLEIELLGPDGNPVDPDAYEVVETPGANPGDPSTYTIKLIDADPSDPDSDPFGDFFNGVVTGNPANTGDGTYTITATDNAGNTNDVGQFEIDTTSPGTPNNGNSPFSPLDITDPTDTGADDLLSSDGNPELTFTGEPGLEIELLGSDGNSVDPDAYEVLETPGVNPGDPSTYTIKLIDADPSDPDSDPFGDFFNGSPTGNGANTGDGIYTITATDNAGNTNDVGQFEIDTTSPGTPNNGNSPFSPLDITDATDTGADDLLSGNGNPELTFSGESGLEIELLGPDGNPVDPDAYEVVETPGANPGDPSTYTIKLVDADPDPSDPDSDPFGDFFNGVVTGNPANTGDGTYTITATDNAGNTNDVGQFEIKTSSLISINDDRGTVVIGDLGFGSINVDVLANDQGLGIQITNLTQPLKGTAVLRDNGTPNNFSDDFLTYHIHEELLDLRSATGPVRIDISDIFSSASYNNSVGFYQVLDHFGTILDPASGRLLTPADLEYRNVALASAIPGLQISKDNPVQSIELPGGGIYAPFLTSDQGNGQVNHFFALIDANPGQVDYVRFANGTYSFEDSAFGDRDFNDLRFAVNILPQGGFVPPAIGLTANAGVFTANGLVDQFTYTITDVNGDNRTASVAIDNQEHLKFTLLGVDGDFKNEVAIFRVDDRQGTINGIAPGQAGYLEAALSNSQVIFTGISGQTQLFGESLTRTMEEFKVSDSFGFLLIQNNSLDMVLREQAAGAISTPVFFSQAIANGNQIQQIPSNDGQGIVVAWEDIAQGGDGDFNDFIFRVAMTDQPAPLGTLYQGQAQQEIFANTSNQNVQIGVQIASDSAYDNTVGFYLVQNAQGTVLDYTTGQLVNPGDANYAEVAVRQRLALGSNGQPIGGEIRPGQIIAPFLISNGTENQFLTVNPVNQAIAAGPVAFFSYINANPDGLDHFRLLADNTFGVEDMLGGGDFDYNDVVIKLDQNPVNRELLDLRSLSGSVNLGINEITGDASFGLSVGFYRVENQFGAIADPLTGQLLNPGDGNYQAVALQNTAAQFTVTPSTTTQALELTGGSLFAPYLTVSQSDGNVFNYFSYLGANPDQADHIRVLGDTFQFEDGFWGGDMDFNDLQFRINIQ
ncbi:Ig-like domain-containing protein, partial [Synechocystis sp. FACHB-898]|uniref:DUF4114 domain-containing protein n=2 Tax=unclassified Synechocystis TaxID=2640012 RepID=UPI0016871EBE